MSRRPPTAPASLLVALGGSAGASARYAVDLVVPGLAATLAVNVVGALCLGVVVFGRRAGWTPDERVVLVVATGFLSAFTTYSTFVVDTVGAAPLTAGGYVLGSYALGFGAVALARWGWRRERSIRRGPEGDRPWR
jgi:CrcB protein